MTAITYAKAEFLGIDGAVIGSGRISFMERVVRESIRDTIGEPGVELEMIIPATERSDPRCPYRLRLTLE